MKKIFILFTTCVAMMACNGNATKATENVVDSDSVAVIDSIDSTVIDTISID